MHRGYRLFLACDEPPKGARRSKRTWSRGLQRGSAAPVQLIGTAGCFAASQGAAAQALQSRGPARQFGARGRFESVQEKLQMAMGEPVDVRARGARQRPGELG